MPEVCVTACYWATSPYSIKINKDVIVCQIFLGKGLYFECLLWPRLKHFPFFGGVKNGVAFFSLPLFFTCLKHITEILGTQAMFYE